MALTDPILWQRRAARRHALDQPPPDATRPSPPIRLGRAGTIRRKLRRVGSALTLLLPLTLGACTLVEVDAAGWHLTTGGIWLIALLAGIPALLAIQRAFLNPACRQPRRRGWLGIELGDGDGGGSDCSDWSD